MMTKMRNILVGTFACCVAATALVACSDDDYEYVPAASSIRIVQNDLVFDSDGSSSTVLVEANGPISATVDADWCHAEVSSRVVTVTADRNYSFEGRTALLTITDGNSSRQLPIQQLGMVLDLPIVNNGHHSPVAGDVFTVDIAHSLPITISTNYDWIHPEVTDNGLRISVDSNAGGHIRRGSVVCTCGSYSDSLHIAQYDIQNDVVGSYYMMGYFGGQPSATRFDIVQRNDSLFMHWPQERYANTYIHTPIDKTTCTLFIPSAFTLYSDTRTTVTGYFYDSNDRMATNSAIGIHARLYYSESAGYNAASPTMANWPGHTLKGFVIRSSSGIGSATLIQLTTPVLMRVGPVGTEL